MIRNERRVGATVDWFCAQHSGHRLSPQVAGYAHSYDRQGRYGSNIHRVSSRCSGHRAGEIDALGR